MAVSSPPVLVISGDQSVESIASLLIDVMERKADEAEHELDRLCLLRARDILLESKRKPPKRLRTVCGQFPEDSLLTDSVQEKSGRREECMEENPPAKESHPSSEGVHQDESPKNRTNRCKQNASSIRNSEKGWILPLDSDASNDVIGEADLSLHSYGLSILEAAEQNLSAAKRQERSLKCLHEVSRETIDSVADKKQSNDSSEAERALLSRPAKRVRFDAERWTSCSDQDSDQSQANSHSVQKESSPNPSDTNNFHGYTLLKGNRGPRPIPLDRGTPEQLPDPRLKSLKLQEVKRLAIAAHSMLVASGFRKLVKPLLPRTTSLPQRLNPASQATIEDLAIDKPASEVDAIKGDSCKEVSGDSTSVLRQNSNSKHLGKTSAESEADSAVSDASEDANSTNVVSEEVAKSMNETAKSCDTEATSDATKEVNATLGSAKEIVSTVPTSEPVESDGNVVSCQQDHIGILPMNLEVFCEEESQHIKMNLESASVDESHYAASADASLQKTMPNSLMPLPFVLPRCPPNIVHATNLHPFWNYTHWQHTSTSWGLGYQQGGNIFYPTMLPSQQWSNTQSSATYQGITYNGWNSNGR